MSSLRNELSWLFRRPTAGTADSDACSRPRTILVLIDLVQDLEILLPIIQRLNGAPGVRLRVIMSRWLTRRAPRGPALLRGFGVKAEYVQRAKLLIGKAPRLDGVDIILTASESTASPHRWGHAVATRANLAGRRTFTIQHGLDNLAALCEPDRRDFASHYMFCWPGEHDLPPALPTETRQRLIPVGRAVVVDPPSPPAFDVGVFENLHDKIYSQDQRHAMLAAILGLAQSRPNLQLLVRTHPAGGWLDDQSALFASLPNVSYVGSREARESLAHASATIGAAARVITTPSTVALDAALCGAPVALALAGSYIYRPLTILRDFQDWLRFADAPARQSTNEAEFIARNLVSGDAVGRICDRLISEDLSPRAAPMHYVRTRSSIRSACP